MTWPDAIAWSVMWVSVATIVVAVLLWTYYEGRR